MAKKTNSVKINGGIKMSFNQCQIGTPVTTDTTQIASLEARIDELEKVNKSLRLDLQGTSDALRKERAECERLKSILGFIKKIA